VNFSWSGGAPILLVESHQSHSHYLQVEMGIVTAISISFAVDRVGEQASVNNQKHSARDEFSRFFDLHSRQHSHPVFRVDEVNQALDAITPTHDRQDHRDAGPDVVKSHDQRAHRQVNKRIQEIARYALLAQPDEELGPRPVLEDVRQAYNQIADNGELLNREFHFTTPLWFYPR